MTQLTGSSCVYLQAIEHPGIQDLVDRISQALPDFSGSSRLRLERNTLSAGGHWSATPGATSGSVLFSGHAEGSANAITSPEFPSPPTTAEIFPTSASLPRPRPPPLTLQLSSSPRSTKPNSGHRRTRVRGRQLQVATRYANVGKRTDGGTTTAKPLWKEYVPTYEASEVAGETALFAGTGGGCRAVMQPFLVNEL